MDMGRPLAKIHPGDQTSLLVKPNPGSKPACGDYSADVKYAEPMHLPAMHVSMSPQG